MFISYLRISCAALVFCFSSVVYADIYTWVDEAGVTQYAQQAPAGTNATLVEVPPPPPIDYQKAQHELDELILQQEVEAEKQQELIENDKIVAEQAANEKENCRIAKQNLEMNQDNPGRRWMDKDGNVHGPDENIRQEKIKQSQQQIDQFCN